MTAASDREHVAEVAAWLKANTKSGDTIFVDQKYPFGFYWQPYLIAENEAVRTHWMGLLPPATCS